MGRCSATILSVVLLAVTGVAAIAAPASAAPATQFVVGQSVTDSTEFRLTGARCPSGTVVYGGGGDIVDGGNEVFLQQLDSFGHTDQFFVQAHEDWAGIYQNWTLYAWAVCGPPLSGMRYVFRRSTADSASRHTVVVSCPEGTRVLSVGGSAVAVTPVHETWRHLILDAIRPSADLTTVTVEGYEDEIGTSEPWRVTASAICAEERPRQLRYTVVSGSDSFRKQLSAECPAGTVPYSAGADLTGPPGQVHFDRLVPHHQSGLTGGDLDARDDRTGTSFTDWTATLHMICAA